MHSWEWLLKLEVATKKGRWRKFGGGDLCDPLEMSAESEATTGIVLQSLGWHCGIGAEGAEGGVKSCIQPTCFHARKSLWILRVCLLELWAEVKQERGGEVRRGGSVGSTGDGCRRGREDTAPCSAVKLGMSGEFVWKDRRRGEALQLAYLLIWLECRGKLF